jgi:hypothetical protein
MKGLRAYLTFNTIFAVFSGLFFLFFAKQLTASQGITLSPNGLIFVQSTGGLIFAVGVLDWYARNLKDKKMMQGVLLTNFLVHATSVSIDVLGVMNGTLDGKKEVVALIIRGLIGLGFLYFLLKKSD